MRTIAACFLAAVALAACGVIGPSTTEKLQVEVQQTIEALPSNAPLPTPLPPTAESLKGLFCEYEFCIGHPTGMPYYDVIAKQDPFSPRASAFDNGILAANNTSLFLELRWQAAPSGADGQFMLDVVLDSQVDSKTGDVQPILLRDLNVFYIPISSTASAALPYGGAAAWVCGGRAFGWKAYAAQPDLVKGLLTDALQAFRCE